MIKYMVIIYAKNHYDEWVQIKHSDIGDIRTAENFRDAILADAPSLDPLNVQVIQYKE